MNHKNDIFFKKIIEEAKNKFNNQNMLIEMEEYCTPVLISNHIFYILVNSKDLYDFLQDINISKFNEIATSIFQDNIQLKFVDNEEEIKELLRSENKEEEINNSELDENLTFSKYIVDDYNKKAVNLLFKILETGKPSFNPIFLYGSTGIGKTHLVNAFAIEYLNKFPDRKVKLINSQNFAREFTEISNFGTNVSSKIENFKKQNSLYDVYIIEDIQFLVNKIKTQEVFFSIFEELIRRKSSIIITSDRYSEHLNGFTDRMISRFSSGVAIKLEFPGEQTATKILKERLKYEDFTLTDDAISLLARHYSTDIRKLLFGVNNLLVDNYTQNRKIVDVDVIVECLKINKDDRNKDYYTLNINPQTVINSVAKYYSIPTSEIIGKSREKKILAARSMAMYIIREHLKLPFQNVADYFNKKHGTAINSVNNFKEELAKNESLQLTIQTILKKL